MTVHRILFISGIIFLVGVYQIQADELLDTSGRFKLELGFWGGVGSDDLNVGTMPNGESVTVSAGGGAGFGVNIGYGITKKLDLDFTIGTQESDLSQDVSNASGSFERTLYLSTLKYKVPFNNKHHLKFGIGVGLYTSGEYDVDTSQVPGGDHAIINYDDTVGYHLTIEYERMIFNKNWSWLLGVKYYNVNYEAESVKINGFSYTPRVLREELTSLDGSGIDFNLGITRYF